ncbi:modular polyketide synthase NorC [Streptomyces sp. 769]|nr:modular polyketide synthase NorC [Streptomyces sp. 769]
MREPAAGAARPTGEEAKAVGEDPKLVKYFQRVTAELQRTRERLRELENPVDDPVAVVGMGCRFGGGIGSPEELWELLAAERDVISGFPAGRGWTEDQIYHPEPGTPGRSYVRHGAFLDDAAGFDSEFFGISPREALSMDPQQRIALEVSWQALESAGIDPAGLRGSRTGVFLGLSNADYATAVREMPEDMLGQLSIGNAGSVTSGRLAYVFGLQGPVLTVDTACSSSLVGIHLAVQSLRAGECTLALAGGVTILSSPLLFIDYARQRALAPDGRCKPFSSAADGTAWGEGAGMLVLEKLSDARRNHHPVLALLRGSAINSDGTSSGLTAPNGTAQQQVIADALASAGLSPADVDAVEAHGTGTALGDPIEAQALLAGYGRHRGDRPPLLVGAVKSNLAHTQAAAGVAGVVKMVLALRHSTLPRTLHIGTATPRVDWAQGGVELLTSAVPWPRDGRPRRAGVSAFGVGGTNAHVILEDPGPDPDTEPGDRAVPPLLAWTLSGRTEQALSAQAAALHAYLDRAHPDLLDLSWSLATARAHLPHRAVVFGSRPADLAAGLTALSTGRNDTGSVTAVVSGTAVRNGTTAFLYPHECTPAVVRALATQYAEAEPFAEHLSACAATLAGLVGWSLTDVLRGDPDVPPLDRPDVLAPATLAVLTGVTRMWCASGVRPAALAGHGSGRLAASWAVGWLSLSSALRIAAGCPAGVEPDVVEVPPPAPGVPVLCGDTGRWLRDRPAEDDYRTVPAAESGLAARELRADGHRLLLVFGGDTAGMAAALSDGPAVLAVPEETESAVTGSAAIVRALGRAHVMGAAVDWRVVLAGAGARRIPLPGYAFQRSRYWIEREWTMPLLLSDDPGTREPDRRSPAALLWALPEQERNGHVETMVRECLNRALGNGPDDQVDAEATFRDLGMDSLGAEDLRDQLTTGAGVEIELADVLNYPTVVDLTERVLEKLAARAEEGTLDEIAGTARSGNEVPESGTGPVDPAPDNADESDGSLASFYIRAIRTGRIDVALRLARAASETRDTFDQDDPRDLAELRQVGAGAGGPTIVGLTPPIFPNLDLPYSYLHAGLDPASDVWSLWSPGFAGEAPLPADRAALLRMLAKPLCRELAGTPLIIAGYSSGGWLAHELATHLERTGVPVTALLLLDSYLPEEEMDQTETRSEFMREQIRRRDLMGMSLDRPDRTVTTSGQIAAMGGYSRIFSGWRPGPLKAPILHLLASEVVAGMPTSSEDHPFPAELAHRVRTLPGDHFTILSQHADLISENLHDWLTEVQPA